MKEMWVAAVIKTRKGVSRESLKALRVFKSAPFSPKNAKIRPFYLNVFYKSTFFFNKLLGTSAGPLPPLRNERVYN